MKNIGGKTGFWECGTTEGDFAENDGKRFCGWCRKMLRVGERVIQDRTPTPFQRKIHFSYVHKKCPEKKDKR